MFSGVQVEEPLLATDEFPHSFDIILAEECLLCTKLDPPPKPSAGFACTPSRWCPSQDWCETLQVSATTAVSRVCTSFCCAEH